MLDDDLGWFPVAVTSLLVLVPAGVGITVIVTGVRRWLRIRRLLARGTPGTAVVIGNQQESASEGRIRFLPVVSFRTRSGQEVRTVLADLGGHRSHLDGTEHLIVYDPDDPQQVTVAGRRTGSLVGVFAIGLVFLAFAAFAYRLAVPMLDGSDPFGLS